MKEEFFFIVKSAALGLAIIVLLQFRVGGVSIESRAIGWVQSSTVVEPLHSVAHGGVKLSKDLYHMIRGKIKSAMAPAKEN